MNTWSHPDNGLRPRALALPVRWFGSLLLLVLLVLLVQQQVWLLVLDQHKLAASLDIWYCVPCQPSRHQSKESRSPARCISVHPWYRD